MKCIAPEAQIIDITHGIPPQHVLQGALVLCNTLPYMPQGVHLAVVDPGVGGHRRPLAIRTGEGRYLVGPDNGLLLPAAERLGAVDAAPAPPSAPPAGAGRGPRGAAAGGGAGTGWPGAGGARGPPPSAPAGEPGGPAPPPPPRWRRDRRRGPPPSPLARGAGGAAPPTI